MYAYAQCTCQLSSVQWTSSQFSELVSLLNIVVQLAVCLMFWCLSLCLPLCVSMSTHYTLSGSGHHSTVAFNLVVIRTRSDRLFTITDRVPNTVLFCNSTTVLVAQYNNFRSMSITPTTALLCTCVRCCIVVNVVVCCLLIVLHQQLATTVRDSLDPSNLANYNIQQQLEEGQEMSDHNLCSSCGTGKLSKHTILCLSACLSACIMLKYWQCCWTLFTVGRFWFDFMVKLVNTFPAV